MGDERWRDLSRLYDEAARLAPVDRAPFLRKACGGDEALRAEIESLLRDDSRVNELLESKGSHRTLIGQRIGGYEIRSLLGVGGMGEVYRARDPKLDRDVAIKVLPVGFASDGERLARFQREARVLASLNHPHIGAIHGFEEASGVPALVLELVEGDTLAERLQKGPISISEALHIARQMADALDTAHEHGIVHRDLKPANVKITPDGIVKVLDFGLAKAVLRAQSPLQTSGLSHQGLVVGTPAYMSPEQARGQPVDRRADIWAFGVIVYEMLTGSAMFAGETASETMALVMTKAPDWSTLPSNTPVRVRELLRRAVTIDPRARLQSIGEARITIEEEISHPNTESGAPSTSRAVGNAALPWAAAALLGVIALLALWAPWRAVSEPRRTVRFDVSAPGGARIAPGHPLSPDGRTLAFVADSEGTPRIWVRPLDSSAAQPLPGTEGATGIFWSPDSQYLGFFAQRQLKRVATRGGPPLVICNVERPFPEGSWGTDNVILIARTRRQGGVLMRVDAAAGGQPTPATEFSKESHHSPSFFPDGRHFLYVAISGSKRQEHLWYVGSLDSKERYPLPGLTGQLGGVAYSPTGHLLFVRRGTLMAQPFDLSRFELSGDAVPVAEQVAAFSISSNGSLAYINEVDSELAWFDQTGRQLGLAGPKGHYLNPELSPDGKFVAFTRGQPPNLWVRDIERGLDTRFTSHVAADFTPIWSPDMRTFAFFSAQERGTLFILPVGVAGEGTLLLEGSNYPADWSRDGHYLIYEVAGDVWALPYPANDSKPLQVTQSPFRETNPRLSPDGRWIAYTSDQSGGRTDVYIQPFLQPGLQQHVSIAGGQTPRWSADGTELFYISPDFALMAVPIARAGSSLRVGTPVRLFQTRMSTGGLGRNYNVDADGRFLINVTTTDLSAAPITVILNWDTALKK